MTSHDEELKRDLAKAMRAKKLRQMWRGGSMAPNTTDIDLDFESTAPIEEDTSACPTCGNEAQEAIPSDEPKTFSEYVRSKVRPNGDLSPPPHEQVHPKFSAREEHEDGDMITLARRLKLRRSRY